MVNLNLLFKNLESDYDKIYYLQRIIGSSANKQIYNIDYISHFVVDREKYFKNIEKTIDNKKILQYYAGVNIVILIIAWQRIGLKAFIKKF